MLDLARGTLVRSGTPVAIRPKTFLLLSHLARHRGTVLSKDALLDAVWPDVTVTEDSLTQCVRDARRVLGNEAQQLLRTVPRRGYVLALPDASAPLPAASLQATAQDAALHRPPEPTVAVLPFKNTGDNSNDGLFIDGIVEEITNGLARFKTVAVIARNSAFAYRGEPGTAGATIGKALGVEFVVEGSVRRLGPRLSIAASLSDARDGLRLWGETFSGDGSDLFALSETIAYRIISRLVANIEGAVLHRPAASAPESIDAFEHLTRGIALLRSYGDGVNERARAHFLRAIALDERYGLAHAYLALTDLIITGYGGAPREALAACRDRAQTALTLAPEEARCHRIMGMVLLCYREHAAAEQHLRRSLDLNPYDADTLMQMGYLLTMRGRGEEALEWMDRAVRLNPIHPQWYHYDRSILFYAAGEYRRAAEELACIPGCGVLHDVRLAACYAMLGMRTKAAAQIRQVFEASPGLPIEDVVKTQLEFERDEDVEHLVRGVQLALDWFHGDDVSASERSAPCSSFPKKR
ncbi:winged helix-turn-helix domain-containing tetratricopeptide repeat protein [Mycoplana dimorpha]|uniref:TolB-like protein n=1 Tax=Mycoplana dimorpha TaxID=28320 RepID=A0A2T5B1E7_MYCDI|nr:winged helix-turn-helix domain-containing protein [Mycoplana dimorpha]PTM92802.1 TolB-like protein [Mycoplana dimorpha]